MNTQQETTSEVAIRNKGPTASHGVFPHLPAWSHDGRAPMVSRVAMAALPPQVFFHGFKCGQGNSLAAELVHVLFMF